jgi:hypothetical protein
LVKLVGGWERDIEVPLQQVAVRYLASLVQVAAAAAAAAAAVWIHTVGAGELYLPETAAHVTSEVWVCLVCLVCLVKMVTLEQAEKVNVTVKEYLLVC